MIFISTSCVKNDKIKNSIEELADAGFTNLELSGGTEFYEDYLADIKDLKGKYGLNILLHNYFPPPKKPFVLNLASLRDDVFEESFEHILKAIKISKELGAEKYAFHSGFLIDIKLSEIGKSISNEKLFDRDQALERFVRACDYALEEAGEDLELYIENNVISRENYRNFDGVNPFFFTDYHGFCEIRKKICIKPLVDLAHLYVSCNTLKKDFSEESSKLLRLTDYAHISGNDGKSDSNNEISEDSHFFSYIRDMNFAEKVITLEVYDDMTKIKSSYKLIKNLKNE